MTACIQGNIGLADGRAVKASEDGVVSGGKIVRIDAKRQLYIVTEFGTGATVEMDDVSGHDAQAEALRAARALHNELPGR